MKNENSNHSNDSVNEKRIWKTATLGAMLAGSIAGLWARARRVTKDRMQRILLARKWFVFTVALLIMSVILTTFLLVGQLDQYFYRKSHDLEIDLMAEPGIELDDGSGNVMFGTESEQKMFHASYQSADGSDFSVLSSNGDEVIAPGTQGEYTFRLNNTEEFEVYYSVTLNGMFSVEDADHLVPVKVRMRGRDGNYLIGSDEEWVYLSKLNDISDAGTLKGNASRYYTIEWMWPYESGNDYLDTMLGNGSVSLDGVPLKPDEDLDFILEIETTAILPVQDRAPFTVFFERSLPILLILTILLLIAALASVIRYRYADKKAKQ